MADQKSSVNDEFRQGLEEALQSKMSELCNLRTLENYGDLSALRCLAQGTGSCRFKVKGWTDPISLSSSDEKTSLLNIFLLFLWHANKLAQLPFDPVDLKITRFKHFKIDDTDGEHSMYKFTEETVKGDGSVETLDMDDNAQSETRIHMAEDLPEELIGPREIDLRRKDDHHSLFVSYRKSTDQRKKYFLESKHISHVRKLSGIDIYSYGYKFNRAVLEKTAPSLEELDVEKLRDMKELELLKDLPMPKLRRLHVWVKWIDEEASNSPFVFAAAERPEGLGGGGGGLRWLRARLPRRAIESLLRANGRTLLELHVDVGTPRGPAAVALCRSDESRWPLSCEDLDAMLVECGLVSLRRLVLSRSVGSHHTRASCAEQAQAVRRALPGVLFECESCRPA